MEGKKRRPHGNREHNIRVRRVRHFWNEGSGFASAIASRNIPCIWDVEARFFIAQRRKSKGSAEEHLFSNQFTTMFPILRDNDIARELIFSKFDEVSLHVFRVQSASDVEGVGLGLISPSSQREYPFLCLEVGVICLLKCYVSSLEKNYLTL